MKLNLYVSKRTREGLRLLAARMQPGVKRPSVSRVVEAMVVAREA